MESTFYELDVGDVVLISQPDYGFEVQDIGKYAEVVAQGDYFGREGVKVKPYAGVFTTAQVGNGQVGVDNVVGYESFGALPLVLLNTLDIERDTTVQNTPTEEYTGSSSNYYKVFVKNPTTLPSPYEAECADIIEALKLDFAEGNVLKALWRRAVARNSGIKKRGYDDGKYDAEKIKWFADVIAGRYLS